MSIAVRHGNAHGWNAGLRAVNGTGIGAAAAGSGPGVSGYQYRARPACVIVAAMAPPRNPGSLKRQKELARQQRQREKREERAARKDAAKDRPKAPPGEDPDAVTPESRVVEAIQNAGYAARKQYAR